MADRLSRKRSRPRLLEQASVFGARVVDVIGWLGGHVLRRRAAQLALVIAAAVVAALVYAFNGPFSSEQQIVIAVSAGFAVFGVAGVYLAYRSWDFARRTARHVADTVASLKDMRAALERQQGRLADGDAARNRIEISLTESRLAHTNAAETLRDQVENLREQLSSGLASLSSVRGDLAIFGERVADMSDRAGRNNAFAAETREQQVALANALDRTDAQLSVLTSRTDTLTGTAQDAFTRTFSLAAVHQELRQALDRLEQSSAKLQTSVEADRAEAATASAFFKAQISGLASDKANIISKLETLRTQLAALVQSAGATADVQELTHKIASLAVSVREFHLTETQRVDQIASRIGSLEAVTVSASARAEEELELLRRSRADAVTSFSSAIAAIDQRADLLESGLAAVAQERLAQTRRIASLEDIVARNISGQAAAADDLASQLSSLRQFAGEESGRLAEVAAVYVELRKKVQRLETFSADGQATIDAIGGRIADLSNELSGVQESLAKVSERAGPQIASLREEFGDGLALARTSIESLRKEFADRSGQVTHALDEHAAVLGSLKNQSAFNASAEERLARLANDIASGREAAPRVEARIDVLEQALATVEASTRSVGDALRNEIAGLSDEIRNKISTLAESTTGIVGKLETGAEQLRARQAELAASVETSASSVRDEIRIEIAALADSTSGIIGKLDAGVDQLRAQQVELAGSVEQSARSVSDDIRRELSALADSSNAMLSKLDAGVEQLRQRQEELAASAFSNHERVANLERSISVGANEVDIVKRAVADMTRAQASATETSRKTTELLHEQFKSIREAMTGEFGRVGALAAKLDALQMAADQDSTITRNEVQDIKTDLAALARQTTEALASVEGRVAEASQLLSSTADLAESTDRKIVLDTASWFEPNNRKLRADHVESVESDWGKRLSLDLSRPAIGYMATRINNLERELDGRLRASIEDTLLRTLVARSIKGPSIRLLELGASFGIESAVMYDQLCDHFSQLTFTIVDPLDAFANDPRIDPRTGLPVSERILRRNLSRAGVPDGDVKLIRRPSADLQALEEASGSAYDVLLIDADRTYAGVKVDFENYGRLVKLGGYVIFAGYGDPYQPEVTAFVDEEVAGSSHVARVGASWHTAVYRTVRSEGGRRKAAVAAAKPVGSTRRQASSGR